ncbi:MAG TPA: biotin/lipoyl-binding protein, partial [Roseiflexaceae bacterium]|nr:biotin/lipoyl-binding protein [Roseiflexaceae bacterium]
MAERLTEVLTAGAENSPEGKRRRLRKRLLWAGPIALLALALISYLTGGRYISTVNAYVQADITLISTDVAGTVASIAVRNNDRVEAGQLLFKIDDETYRIAVRGAEAQLAMVRNDIVALKATYQQKLAEIKQSEADIVFYERDASRQADLYKGKATSLADWDEARHKLDQARANRISLQQQADSVLAQLGGTADPQVETHARYLQAKAQVDKAERDLRRTSISAPATGIVTNVDKLQVGQYLSSAQAAFSLISTEQVW